MTVCGSAQVEEEQVEALVLQPWRRKVGGAGSETEEAVGQTATGSSMM